MERDQIYNFFKECKILWKQQNRSMGVYKPINKCLYQMIRQERINEDQTDIEQNVNEVSLNSTMEWYKKHILSKSLTKIECKKIHKQLINNKDSHYERLRCELRSIKNKKYYNEVLRIGHTKVNELKTDIQKAIEIGTFRNGILVKISDQKYTYLLRCQLINNSQLDQYFKKPTHYLSGTEYMRIVKYSGYSDHRYGSFDSEFYFIQYPQPLLIYLFRFGWGSTENSFMQCFMKYVDSIRDNEPLTKQLRQIDSVFSQIDTLLNPEYPRLSPRTPHGSISLYKQKLFTLKSIYDKTNKDFKDSIDDILDYYNFDRETFFNLITNN